MKAIAGLLMAVFLVTNGFAQDDEILDAMDLDAIRAKAGMDAVVEGLVTDIGTSKGDAITFVNIGMPKKQGFVALIFQKDYAAFPDGFDQYRNQKVRVKGLVKLYRSETPQIIMTSPDQIEVITE